MYRPPSHYLKGLRLVRQRMPVLHQPLEGQETSTDQLRFHILSGESTAMVLGGRTRCHCKAKYLRESFDAVATSRDAADSISIRQTHDAPTQASYRPFTSVAPHPNSTLPSATPLPGVSPYRPATLNSEPSSEKRFSSMEKGKGRIPSPPPNGTQSYINRPVHPENQNREAAMKNSNGHHGEPPKPNPPTTHVTINPAAIGNLSPTDKAFAERVEANNRKPVLGRNIKGLCPVWSNTRRGLQSALEYMRNPIKTAGASVDISPGGMARGIILEGQTPSDLAYWGEQEEGGTLILPM
jgi:hypothetical protein